MQNQIYILMPFSLSKFILALLFIIFTKFFGRYTFFNRVFTYTKYRKASKLISVRLFADNTKAFTLDFTR